MGDGICPSCWKAASHLDPETKLCQVCDRARRAGVAQLPDTCPYCKHPRWCRSQTRAHRVLTEHEPHQAPTYCGSCPDCLEHRQGCPPTEPDDPGLEADRRAIAEDDALRRRYRDRFGDWPDW